MNPEPQKFFVGLIDFFAVWLPGAMLVYLLMGDAGTISLGHPIKIEGTEGWVVFLFASFVAGQLAFLLGSLLDEGIYDRLRNGTPSGQIRCLAQGMHLSSRFTRRLGNWLFNNDDKAFRQALIIKKAHLDWAGADDAVNAFQWSKARLTLDHPDAIAEVQRYEADSKFFRSFCTVLLILALWEALKGGVALVAPNSFLTGLAARGDGQTVTLVLAGTLIFVAAFWRYVERRGKSIEQAYWFMIATHHAKPIDGRPGRAPTNDPVRAGGVVVRYSVERGHEYLRVQAKDEPGQWVLPKGHVERWETPPEAAVREVLEETGCWARVDSRLKDVKFMDKGEYICFSCYLMEYLELRPEEPYRLHPWLPAPLPCDEEEPRLCEWRSLSDYEDLPAESQQAVLEAAVRLAGHPYEGTHLARKFRSAAALVASSHPPPSTREPS